MLLKVKMFSKRMAAIRRFHVGGTPRSATELQCMSDKSVSLHPYYEVHTDERKQWREFRD